MQGSSRDT
jgi:hypothetical protein